MKDGQSNRKTEGKTIVLVASVVAAVAALATLAINAPVEDAVIGDEVFMATTVPPSLSLSPIESAHAAVSARGDERTRPAVAQPRADEAWNADESSRGSRPDATH